MPEFDRDSTDSMIDDIDVMARTTYTWVRQQTFEQRFLGLPVSASEEADLAAGFLAGLRVRLMLADADSILLAYVYALMAGESQGATTLAHELMNKGGGAKATCSGYSHGLNAARELLTNNGLDAHAALRRIAPSQVPFKEH